MSLINDALKRATSLRKKSPPALPDGLAPMAPAGDPPPGNSKALPVILGVVLLGVAGYFGWSYFGPKPGTATAQNDKGTNKSAKASAATASKTDSAKVSPGANNPIARAAAIAGGIKAQNDQGASVAENLNAGDLSATAKSETPGNTISDTASNPASAPKAASASSSPVDFPSVQLQAIFFKSKNPAAVINGKTLRVGEEVGGVKVKQIARDEIKVEYQGQTKSLSLK